MTAAMATHPANHAHGWWVSPDVMVRTVRPPGMKRAVMSSSPPRLRICVVGPLQAPPRLLPAGGAALDERAEAPADQVGGVVAEERAGGPGGDHEEQVCSPAPAATPPRITVVSLGTIGMIESRKAMTRMTSRNHHSAETSSNQSVRSVEDAGEDHGASGGYRSRGANQTVVSAGPRCRRRASPVVRIGDSPATAATATGCPLTLQATTTAHGAARRRRRGRRRARPRRLRVRPTCRDQPPVQRQHRGVVGVLRVDGVGAPPVGLRQPRSGGRPARTRGRRRRRPRQRHATPVATDRARRRAGEHGILARVVGQVEHLGQAQLLALVQVHRAGHREQQAGRRPRSARCRGRCRAARRRSAGCTRPRRRLR